ncbi:MAG TPA: glycoside hydrolase family 2 TIM barrel-domain containing protein [Solirubrobacteraceae bacterium]|nr:glycoside hydrolase family 2 TIM barrel-domain containing protein [Solirubrobacteraceae bacterium]
MTRRSMQTVLLAVLALGLPACLPPPVRADAQTVDPPQAIPLTTGWQRLMDPHDRGLTEHLQTGVGGTGWTSVSVPDVFDARLLPALYSGTIGWYRVHFRTPDAPGFAWAAHFAESRRVTEVWINGHEIGSNSDPYTSFQFDLGGLKAGAENTLVVRVDNRKKVQPREGWWNWGGLVQPVSLVPVGAVTVSDLGVMPQLTCPQPDQCSGHLLVDAVIANRSPTTLTPTMMLTLTPPSGSSAPSQVDALAPGTLRPGQTASVRFAVPLHGQLDLWEPGHPSLYQTELDTSVGALVTQRNQLAVGMRRADVRGGLLYLNGRQIDLRGASIEEDFPGRGAALTTAEQQQIVTELQALHANVTRSQYPLSQPLLDMLDKAGIMIWTEAPVYNRDDLLHTPAQRAVALDTLRDAVLSTRSHPSVLTESVANELTPTPDVVPGTKAYLDAAVPLVRQLDPDVPVADDVLSYPGYPAQRTYQQFDMLGISNYYGWYTGQQQHSTASISGLAPFMKKARARYPKQAIVMSEFGAEASAPGPASAKGSYAFQSAFIEKTLGIVANLPFLSGALYWTVREFAVKPHWDGGPPRKIDPHTSIHHKGLISYAGVPKPAFAVTARLFAATPFYRSPPITPAGVATGGGPGRGAGAVGWALLAVMIALGLALAGSVRSRRRVRYVQAPRQ